MKFNGFRSIAEYERECARLGYTTERIPFYRGEEEYFALVTAPPGFNGSGSAVRSWHLFTADESAEVLDGVDNGLHENWLGKLATHGFA